MMNIRTLPIYYRPMNYIRSFRHVPRHEVLWRVLFSVLFIIPVEMGRGYLNTNRWNYIVHPVKQVCDRAYIFYLRHCYTSPLARRSKWYKYPICVYRGIVYTVKTFDGILYSGHIFEDMGNHTHKCTVCGKERKDGGNSTSR